MTAGSRVAAYSSGSGAAGVVVDIKKLLARELGDGFAGDGRVVGDDAVDAEQHGAGDFGVVVDRPGVDGHAVAPGGVYECCGEVPEVDREAAEADRLHFREVSVIDLLGRHRRREADH